MKPFAPGECLVGDDPAGRSKDHSYANQDERRPDNPKCKIKVEVPDIISASYVEPESSRNGAVKLEIKQEQAEDTGDESLIETKPDVTVKSEPIDETVTQQTTNQEDTTDWNLLRDIKVEVVEETPDDQPTYIDDDPDEALAISHMYQCSRCSLYFDDENMYVVHCVQCERRSTLTTNHSHSRLQDWKRLRRRILNEKASKDPLDTFFLSMCETTKSLPHHLQIEVKRQVFQAVIKAEEVATARFNGSYHGS